MTPRAERFADLLASRSKTTVRLAELWQILDEAAPECRGSADRRAILADILVELAASEVLEPSSSKDPSRARPPLPRFIRRKITRSHAPAPRRDDPWHPDLSRSADLRRPRPELRPVSEWLFRGGTRADPAPLRERAFEITGDEKAFDGRLDDILTLDVLRAYRVTLPLHRARVGDGRILLVVENSDTFDSLRRTLTADPGRVGEIGWGAGGAFESSVLSLRDDPPTEIRYFGDLDADGIRIPAAASALAEEADLPRIYPATGLYDLLLERGQPKPSRRAGSEERIDDLLAWLDPAHRTRARDLLTGGSRLAQEAVSLAALSESSSWRRDLE